MVEAFARQVRAFVRGGADAVVAINTVRAMAIDLETQRPVLGNRLGGLSGPAIKPIALAMVWEVASVVNVPVVGCGGIMTVTDAIEFLMAGASAVQVGSATFANPHAALDVLEGINAFLKREGLTSLKEIIGAAGR
jgi:dihydroorotate dehydrogenase (NAD+) catalytic subunit